MPIVVSSIAASKNPHFCPDIPLPSIATSHEQLGRHCFGIASASRNGTSAFIGTVFTDIGFMLSVPAGAVVGSVSFSFSEVHGTLAGFTGTSFTADGNKNGGENRSEPGAIVSGASMGSTCFTFSDVFGELAGFTGKIFTGTVVTAVGDIAPMAGDLDGSVAAQRL